MADGTGGSVGSRETFGATTMEDAGGRSVSRRSRQSLDWFIFFVADIQTGFGAVVAVFLTTQKWLPSDIGIVLTAGTLVSLLGQIPIGALVDRLPSPRSTASVALVAIGASALAFAAWPIFPVVLVSRIVHATASCALGFSIVSLSLGLASRSGASARLGRNAAFAAAGTGVAAAAMGACGYFFSPRVVFFIAAASMVPAIYALSRIRREEIRPASAGEAAAIVGADLWHSLAALAQIRPLLIFAACVILFHLANAAMLPLAASMLTLRSSQAATIMVAASIVVPQAIVTVLSPWVGHKAQVWGRRPFLIIGFAALAVRGACFVLTGEPYALVAVQALDGISGAMLGVLVPLTIADLTRDSGHLNLAQGAIGSAMGIGASVSTTLSGYVAGWYGSYTAFTMLAIFAVAGMLICAVFMPETVPRRQAA